MERLIVDGYNVIHAWPTLKRLLGVSLEAAIRSVPEAASPARIVRTISILSVDVMSA